MTDATLDVLEVLLSQDNELYGLKIAQATGRPTGSIYPILARLEQIGWMTSEWEPGDDPAVRGSRRRFYQLTPNGIVAARTALAKHHRATSARRSRLLPPLAPPAGAE
jgi:DNA-binding PadR family transcriptional regulator